MASADRAVDFITLRCHHAGGRSKYVQYIKSVNYCGYFCVPGRVERVPSGDVVPARSRQSSWQVQVQARLVCDQKNRVL